MSETLVTENEQLTWEIWTLYKAEAHKTNTNPATYQLFMGHLGPAVSAQTLHQELNKMYWEMIAQETTYDICVISILDKAHLSQIGQWTLQDKDIKKPSLNQRLSWA